MEPAESAMLSGPVVRGRKNPLHYGLPLRLGKAREAAGVSIRLLAERSSVAATTIRHVENSKPRVAPGVDVVEKLARALGIEPCILAYGIHGEEKFSQKVPGGAGRPGDLPLPSPAPARRTGPLACEGVAARLAAAREAQGLTSKDLGQQSGTTGQTVANIEAGRNVPSVATVEALAVTLDVSPCWLAYDVGEGPARAGG